METVLMEQCRAIREAVDFFQMEKLSGRLMRLGPGAEIKQDVDHELSFEDGA